MRWWKTKDSTHQPSSHGEVEKSLVELVAKLTATLKGLASDLPSHDAVYLEQATYRIGDMLVGIHELARGRLMFTSTESWRTVYETILSTCPTKRYLSVALVHTDGYWQDRPSEASLELNYHLVERGFQVHRLFVIDEYYWPPGSPLPDQQLLARIHQQFVRGIEIGLVRLGDIQNEPELAQDMGIYGRRAVGYQIVDADGKTARFELRFDEHSIRTAEQQWDQLRLFEISLDQILDRPH